MITRHKPDPMGAIQIMQALGVMADRTMLIGDSPMDIESGKQAKCRYLVTILSDITDHRFSMENSDAVVGNFRDIRII